MMLMSTEKILMPAQEAFQHLKNSKIFEKITELVFITQIQSFYDDSDANLKVLQKLQRKSEQKKSIAARNAIRSFCSCVEGISNVIRAALGKSLSEEFQESDGFTKKEHAFLTTEKPSGSGVDVFKATFKCYAHKYNLPLENAFGGAEFDRLKSTFEIRNRLMHPKQATDLEISNQDIICLTEAIGWFMKFHTSIFKGVISHVDSTVEEIQRIELT